MARCVVCLQNHDQIGNRAFGERLHHQIDQASWRAASVLLLTAPMTPLLFMGQEWAASTPFRYFTDLEPGVGAAVTDGRRREFKDFPEFADPGARAGIPDPQDPATFEQSRLRWEERQAPPHAQTLALYRSLLRLRAAHPALAASEDTAGEAWAPDDDSVVLRRRNESEAFWIVVRLRGTGEVDVTSIAGRDPDWQVVLTTEDPAFAIDPRPVVAGSATVRFERPGAVVLQQQGGRSSREAAE
jgi:maltooligosyltrehalose trehalohydrolase